MSYQFDVALPNVDTSKLTKGAKLNYSNSSSEIKYIFEAFDTDDEKGILSEKELKEALDYLAQKEKEIAVKGKKGDRVISYADFNEIAKDNKFEKARKEIEKDRHNFSVGEAIAFAAHMLSKTTHQNSRISAAGPNPVEYVDFNNSSARAVYPEKYGETKIIDKQQVTLMSTGGSLFRLKDKDGNYVDDPDLVAKAHGLNEKDSFLYQIGRALHSESPTYRGKSHIVKHKVYEYEYVWDNERKAFVITKEVDTGRLASSTR